MSRNPLLLLLFVLLLAPAAAEAQQPVVIPTAPSWAVTERCYDSSKIQTAVISTATAGDLELVGATASQVIYVCGYKVVAGGTVSVRLIYGTGSNCATGQTGLEGAIPLVANSGFLEPNTGAVQTKTPAGQALCIETSASVQVSGRLLYVKEP
jgi:hypothetical protein